LRLDTQHMYAYFDLYCCFML